MEDSRRSSSDAARGVLAATLFAVAEAAFCATVQMPGSLTDEDVPHSVGEAARRWEVEFLGSGESRIETGVSDWRLPFRATKRATGETKTFRSGTEDGFFVLARTYESLALIGADVGSGGWGFTVYDIEDDRKIVEFQAAFPHLSPDNRYLAYRKSLGRRALFDPTVRIVDLARVTEGLEIADMVFLQEVGEVAFPRPPPADRSELDDAYGRSVIHSGFDHVAWDMDEGMLYFTATDRAGCLNLVAFDLEAMRTACYVPLTSIDLRSEYFEGRLKRWQGTTGIAVRPPGTVVVSLRNNFYVRSTYEIGLREACREQNPEFAESLGK